jgi:hypothetical protein
MRLKKAVWAGLLVAMFPLALTAQDRTTGGIKGKVKVETGSASGVSIVVREGEREVASVTTSKDGEFMVSRLKPGIYGVTFRKPGLSVATIESVEVKAGKTRSLGDRLVLTIDEGSIAFIRGSVFNAEGRSFAGARIELARILEDGSTKKIDGRISNETGSFVFRLTPDTAKYRITAKANGREPITQDVTVEGAAVYRLALSFQPQK